ncbi:MAG: alpha/beta fold hydrolase [Acidobacteriota bacterium]
MQATAHNPATLPPRLPSATRRIRLLATIAALGLVWAAPGSAREARRADKDPVLTAKPHAFEAASGERVEAEIGTFRVPENRHRADSRWIELSFVRFPATGEAPGAPIVYLAGGPGGSGSGTARGGRFPLFMALRELGDVIAFDQRGTGLSSPLPFCPAPPRAFAGGVSTRRQILDGLSATARHCAAFWKERGIDLNGYTTEQSADDLEDLRRALGAEKIRLWGISYGTHLAFAALRQHGESGGIESAVLASAEGPDHTLKLPSRTQAFLERLLTEEERETLARVLERLGKEPAIVPVPGGESGGEPSSVTISKLELQILIGYMIKNPDSQRALSPWIAAMGRGDFSPVAPFARRIAGSYSGMRGMSEAMDAASGITAERLARVRREAPGTLLEDTLNFPGTALREPLGIRDLGDAFREPLVSDVPVLFLSGTLDGRTYVESHRELAAGFENSAHVIVEGAGHDLFMASPEVARRIADFLAGRPVSEKPIRAGGESP